MDLVVGLRHWRRPGPSGGGSASHKEAEGTAGAHTGRCWRGGSRPGCCRECPARAAHGGYVPPAAGMLP
eukprot:7402158-Pyramimonas_sp.AAC.1